MRECTTYQHFASRLPDTSWTRRADRADLRGRQAACGHARRALQRGAVSPVLPDGQPGRIRGGLFSDAPPPVRSHCAEPVEGGRGLLCQAGNGAADAAGRADLWVLPAHVPEDADETARRERLDLFACETAQAVAEILSLLEKRLDPALGSGAGRGASCAPCTSTSRREGAGTRRTGRSCRGQSMYIYCFSERLSGVRDTLAEFLSGYPADGCCLEGSLYWVRRLYL